MLRTWVSSARYPAIASSTSSSGARPVVAASSWRRDSVSGLRRTTIFVSLETRRGPVKSTGVLRRQPFDSKLLLAGGPFSAFLFLDRLARFWRRVAGRARAPQLEFLIFRVDALFRGCSRAAECASRLVFLRLARKIRSRARPPQTPVSRWPPQYPSRRLAIGRREACSSSRCRGLLGEGRAKFPRAPARFSSSIAQAANGNRSAATSAHLL